MVADRFFENQSRQFLIKYGKNEHIDFVFDQSYFVYRDLFPPRHLLMNCTHSIKIMLCKKIYFIPLCMGGEAVNVVGFSKHRGGGGGRVKGHNSFVGQSM